MRHWRPAEAHASPLAQSPALAVSCREADNLGDAEGAYQRKSGRFQRAGVGCSHLPRSDQTGR